MLLCLHAGSDSRIGTEPSTTASLRWRTGRLPFKRNAHPCGEEGEQGGVTACVVQGSAYTYRFGRPSRNKHQLVCESELPVPYLGGMLPGHVTKTIDAEEE